MNVIVYGVHHWTNEKQSDECIAHCKEWYDRIMKFVPNVKKVIIATGNYCNLEFNPFPKEVQIIQNKIPLSEPYSRKYNYFRNGFMTGIWHTLLNEENWDVLFHVQGRVLLGKDLANEFKSFIENEKVSIMAPRFTQFIGTSVEISIIAMKPNAVQKYATSAIRQSFECYNEIDMNCEDEAYIMFSNAWYNPWPQVISNRQLDYFNNDAGIQTNELSPFAIMDETEFNKLPFIATGDKHVTSKFLNSWKENNPC